MTNDKNTSDRGQARELGVYLLSPTHVGTGQALGAVDLPIAREVHTQWPLLPSTALKGVARDAVENGDRSSPIAKALFGPRPPQKADGGVKLTPGELVLTDAQILAFPVASLTAPFYWVTSPLVIARWVRARRAWGLDVPSALPNNPCATFPSTGALVLGDQVIDTSTWNTADGKALEGIVEAWRQLLPAEDPIAVRLAQTLVCVDDATFGLVLNSGIQVNARVQLTDGKTTDTYRTESGEEQKGNLWYEESLPCDCLFSGIVAPRKSGKALKDFSALVEQLGEATGRRLQIGGNETIGHGFSWWRLGAP